MRTNKVINRFLSVFIAMAMIFVIPATTLKVSAADAEYNVFTEFKGGLGEYLYKYVLNEKTSTITQSQLDSIDHLLISIDPEEITFTSFPNMSRFTNLRIFAISNTTATSLDLSKNSKIQTVSINGCSKLTSISLNKASIESILINGSALTEFNVSDCPKLNVINLQNNRSLKTVSINNCPNLKELGFSNNFDLQTITGTNSFANVFRCNLETNLNLSFVPLTSMPNLEELKYTKNPNAAFDISKCSKLRYLQLSVEVGTLNISNNPALLHAVYDESGKVSVGNYDVYMVASGEYNDVRLMVPPGTKITPSFVCGISSYYFNDPAVLSYVRNKIDTNGDGFLSSSEVNGTTYIDLKNSYVEDASSLKIFKNLSVLNLSGNSITTFDMTPFTKMGNLDLSNNPLQKFTNTNTNSNLYILKIYGCALAASGLSIETLPLMKAAFNGTLDDSKDEYNHYYSSPANYGLFVDRSTKIDGISQPTKTPTPTTNPTKPTTNPTKPTTNPSKPTTNPTKPTTNPSKPTTSPNPTTAPVSNTGVKGFCERLYTCALGRSSDPAGVQSWVDAIKNGADGAKAARGFFFSDEFINKKLDNKEFVTRLYKTFMDREPDAAGLKAWVDALNGGASREDVFNGFVNSQEWANVCFKYGIKSGGTAKPNIKLEPSKEILAFAERLYTTCLGRSADPSGLKAWATALANREGSGAKVAHGFFFSDEFINKKLDNKEFVRRCYLTFMDREPDAGGYKAWIDALEQGATREQVFNGFVKSPEFVAICEKAGIIAFG